MRRLMLREVSCHKVWRNDYNVGLQHQMPESPGSILIPSYMELNCPNLPGLGFLGPDPFLCGGGRRVWSQAKGPPSVPFNRPYFIHGNSS